VAAPFGREVALPENIGDPLGFLLEPLGLAWTPASRFATLPARGAYRASYQPQQDAVSFDLCEPGRQAASDIVRDWRHLLRNGYLYASVDVPVGASGLGPLYDMLSEAGFFAAGFVPYHLGDTLGFRFQALGPAKVSFAEIKAASAAARKLKAFIEQDFKRSTPA
jgi:hypothetical protein